MSSTLNRPKGRPPKYKTAEEKRNADLAKKSRYYTKHRARILAQMRDKYARDREAKIESSHRSVKDAELRSAASNCISKPSESKPSPSNSPSMSPISQSACLPVEEEDNIARFTTLLSEYQTSYHSITTGSRTLFLDGITTSFIQHTPTFDDIDACSGPLSSLLQKLQELTTLFENSDHLQTYRLRQQTLALKLRVEILLEHIEVVGTLAMDDSEDLERLHRRGRLEYQRW